MNASDWEFEFYLDESDYLNEVLFRHKDYVKNRVAELKQYNIIVDENNVGFPDQEQTEVVDYIRQNLSEHYLDELSENTYSITKKGSTYKSENYGSLDVNAARQILLNMGLTEVYNHSKIEE